MTKRQFELLQLFNCIPLIGILPWVGLVIAGVIMVSAHVWPGDILSWLLIVSCVVYPWVVIHGVKLGYVGLRNLSKNALLKGLAFSYGAPAVIVLLAVLHGLIYRG